jgi:hypothetical protein
MRIADGFEHFLLPASMTVMACEPGDGRKTYQEIINGFTAFEGVNQILQRDSCAVKYRRGTHDFGIGVNDAFQIFDCHHMAKILRTEKLSPANMDKD